MAFCIPDGCQPKVFLSIWTFKSRTSQAQALCSSLAKKRFYKNVDVISAGGLYEVVLDSKKMKTPNGAFFQIKSEPLALAVAHEWSTQKENILLSQMHLTGLCNVCIDNPTKATKYELVDSILNFLDTDTVLFFADVSILTKSWLSIDCIFL